MRKEISQDPTVELPKGGSEHGAEQTTQEIQRTYNLDDKSTQEEGLTMAFDDIPSLDQIQDEADQPEHKTVSSLPLQKFFIQFPSLEGKRSEVRTASLDELYEKSEACEIQVEAIKQVLTEMNADDLVDQIINRHNQVRPFNDVPLVKSFSHRGIPEESSYQIIARLNSMQIRQSMIQTEIHSRLREEAEQELGEVSDARNAA